MQATAAAAVVAAAVVVVVIVAAVVVAVGRGVARWPLAVILVEAPVLPLTGLRTIPLLPADGALVLRLLPAHTRLRAHSRRRSGGRGHLVLPPAATSLRVPTTPPPLSPPLSSGGDLPAEGFMVRPVFLLTALAAVASLLAACALQVSKLPAHTELALDEACMRDSIGHKTIVIYSSYVV